MRESLEGKKCHEWTSTKGKLGSLALATALGLGLLVGCGSPVEAEQGKSPVATSQVSPTPETPTPTSTFDAKKAIEKNVKAGEELSAAARRLMRGVTDETIANSNQAPEQLIAVTIKALESTSPHHLPLDTDSNREMNPAIWAGDYNRTVTQNSSASETLRYILQRIDTALYTADFTISHLDGAERQEAAMAAMQAIIDPEKRCLNPEMHKNSDLYGLQKLLQGMVADEVDDKQSRPEGMPPKGTLIDYRKMLKTADISSATWTVEPYPTKDGRVKASLEFTHRSIVPGVDRLEKTSFTLRFGEKGSVYGVYITELGSRAKSNI